MLRLVHEGLFGLRFGSTGITFRPVVPPQYAGEWSLRSLRYRAATLDLTLRGEGTDVRSVQLDGNVVADRQIPPNLTGPHHITITVA